MATTKPRTLPSLARNDPMPEGPYTVDLSLDDRGQPTMPYVIRAKNHQVVCGWIESKNAAHAICAALNAASNTRKSTSKHSK